MKARSKVAWKLTAVVAAILTVAIGLSGYAHHLIWTDYSRASAESFLRLNSQQLVRDVGLQMLSRDEPRVSDVLREVARQNQMYRDVRVVSHHSGEVVASTSGKEFPTRKLDNRACAVCHDRTDLGADAPQAIGTLVDRAKGSGILSVTVPVLKEKACSTADCHQHADSPSILGFVSANYSLDPSAVGAGERTMRVVLTAAAALLLGVVAAWFMFGQLLERPFRELIEGTKRIAARQLDFRFARTRNDEIGVLEESFNSMTAKIKASQDELRDAKEYLEGIIENSADIVITVNAEGLIEMFNRGGEEALGYRREEMIGREIESLYVEPGERRAAVAILEKTGHVKNYETRLRTKDGQIRNVLLTLSRLQDSDGRFIGTIGISKDITQEKKLQDDLRDAKEYLEGMVENSADIIITVNSEGLIETFNRGGEEALGYHRDEVIGKKIETLFVEPRDRHAAADLLDKTGDVKNYETRLLSKDGQVRNVLLTLSRLQDSEGRPIGTIGISKDVTQETKLQRELIQSQRFAAIGQAVTGIQHAIKNMLMSLQGGSYLIRNGMAKDDREQIEEGRLMLEDGIRRIHGLSHNMLNLAKQWRPDLQKVDLNKLVADLCEANRPTAAEQGVALRHEPADNLPMALCDPKLIHTATTDILVNAIDACTWKDYHAGESPEVVLRNSLTENGDFCVIQVRDNGCGMSEEIKRNVFTPFFSTKKTLGTGLGLAVTAKIIRAHEGEISVESKPDRGSTFRICIPKDGPKEKRGGG